MRLQDELESVLKILQAAEELEEGGRVTEARTYYQVCVTALNRLANRVEPRAQWLGAGVGTVLGLVLLGPMFWTGSLVGAWCGHKLAEEGWTGAMTTLKARAEAGLVRLK